MGIYDRDYYQEDQTPQRTRVVRKFSNASITNKLVIINVAVYLVCWLLCTSTSLTTEVVYDALAIGNDFFSSPWELWRVVSYGFMHSPFWEIQGSIWHILGNCFVLWMFGRFIGQRYGSAEFLRFYLLAIVFSGLIFVAATMGDEFRQAIGASGGVVAIVILFCFLYPHEKILLWGVLPMPAWLLGVFYVGYDIMTAVNQAHGSGSAIAWQAHLGGAGFAAAYFLLKLDFGRMFSFNGKRKPKLSVYRDEQVQEVVADEPSAERQLIEQGEEILKRVYEKGESSLTARQRKTLERYSELMKQRRGQDDGKYRY